MSSFSLETSTPTCTVSDFMLYYPCLEAEPGGLTPSRNAYTTVEPLDETRRWAELTRRVMPLDLLEPRRRRPVRERPFRAGRSVRTLVRLNSSIVYHIPIRQDLITTVKKHGGNKQNEDWYGSERRGKCATCGATRRSNMTVWVKGKCLSG